MIRACRRKLIKEKSSPIHPDKAAATKNIQNKAGVYFVNIIHILGVLFIQFGLLLPYPVLKYYMLFLIFVYMTYFFDNVDFFFHPSLVQ